ncbi:MAG: hypothetical protein E6F99_21415 [Actinobacteria bacterium]|nr:MAG: hypothetical protein E6F99_21415 [Actinomycetota bacterium]
MRNGSAPAESPVFVDRSGIRRRWFVILGVAGAGALTLAVLVLVAGFFGAGPGRLPGLPGPLGPVARQAAAPVTSAPSTAARASHPATPSGAPGPRPSPTPGVPSATASPTPIRHGNAPPHPSHRKS